MIPKGYILQPRIYDDSEASKFSPVTRELWHYLLRNVNHKDVGKYKRGQGFFSFADIQEALSWYVGYRKMKYSKPQLTKALRRLNEGNMTETMKATRGIIITVCNYSYYQDPGNYEGNDEGSTKDQRRKREGHTKNKNDKNVIKNKLYIHLLSKIESENLQQYQPKIIEFFEYRMNKPKKDQYKSEKGVNGLFRDIKNCIRAGMHPEQFLEIAMEKEWKTPDPKYYNAGNYNNTQLSRTESNIQAAMDFANEGNDGA